jgi:hypothetical protein
MTVSPFFSRNIECGIVTWLTRLGIGTDCGAGVAAIAGEVRAVAEASNTRGLKKRMVLNSPVDSFGWERSLAAL